jgi:subtilisin family serine protease/subtilisin-like proprotein convertase family protein
VFSGPKVWRAPYGGLRAAILLFLVILPSLAQAAEGSNAVRRVTFREPHSVAYLIEQPALALQKLDAHAPWTRARRDDGSTNIVELGSRVVLQINSTGQLQRLLAGRSLQLSRQVSSNLFILQAADSAAAIDHAAGLALEPGVSASHPVVRRALKLHRPYARTPSDPYFGEQWHLENRGANGQPLGIDLNVRAAWPVTRGQDVLVAIGDDGIDLGHTDLATPTTGAPHFNFTTIKANGNPQSSDANHGTAVAGLIAATGSNGRGVSGVAPQASLASWVIFGTSFFGSDTIADNESLMDMFQYASNRVSVQNHSWGNASLTQEALDSLSEIGIANAVNYGRGGKGIVIVRAGGNGRDDLINVNDDGYANDPRAISVGAVRSDGRVCSYSSPGACLLVSAPSGDPDDNFPNLMTTDRRGTAGYNPVGTGDRADYAFGSTGFNGTSASAPQIAGIAALILGANPNLTYRDVQQILVHAARQLDPADPDLHLNGAGFVFSHNTGFGVPDAGFAVALAQSWPNRPPTRRITLEDNSTKAIPDDALKVVADGPGLSSALRSIRCLPSLGGPHADAPTDALPLVYVGQANSELTEDLHGKAALIQRGVSFFSDKIARAARAGAAFVIIFNNVNSTEIVNMVGTTFSTIPAVSISQNDGQALRDFILAHPETTAQLKLTPVVTSFTVTDTLVCEHVGVRLKTNHRRREDVRVTLVSPQGTRSVLQAINSDSSRGPTDWTYWSTQHFYESSAGPWRVEVSDERFTSSGTGSITYAALLIDGVTITDTDRDGLDDAWEMRYFGSLSPGPRDDSDGDGYSNAREQVLGTSPVQAGPEFRLDISPWSDTLARLSWPAAASRTYRISSGANSVIPLSLLTNVVGKFPEAELFVPYGKRPGEFFQVRTLPAQ